MKNKYPVFLLIIFLLVLSVIIMTFLDKVSIAEYLISSSLIVVIISYFVFDNVRSSFLSIVVFIGCIFCFVYQIANIIG